MNFIQHVGKFAAQLKRERHGVRSEQDMNKDHESNASEAAMISTPSIM